MSLSRSDISQGDPAKPTVETPRRWEQSNSHRPAHGGYPSSGQCTATITGARPKAVGYDPDRCVHDAGHRGSHYADFTFWNRRP
jgi:hypothetical protein